MTIELIEEHFCFDGIQRVYAHKSIVNDCIMRFGLFMPPHAKKHRVPVLYWLSGLTCTEQNFITKAGAQRVASELGLAIVVPDTSPRDLNLPDDDMDYYFGVGAGFYVDAIKTPWSKHYRMASYVQQELPELLKKHFPLDHKACGIFGHSMGGHGALTLALKNPTQYRSVSALAPICAPTQCSFGKNAFTGYLGTDKNIWKMYDACELVVEKGWPHQMILVDQGMDDEFLQEQLKPELFRTACEKAGVKLNLRMQAKYDHSYYFVASFIEDHLRFHATNLK